MKGKCFIFGIPTLALNPKVANFGHFQKNSIEYFVKPGISTKNQKHLQEFPDQYVWVKF